MRVMNKPWKRRLWLDTGISSRVLDEIQKLAQKHEIGKVILFGSRARGDFHRTSDIDLAVSGGYIPAFALDVDEQTWTLLSFDVVNLDRPLPKELVSNIKKDGVVLYEKV